MQCPKCESKKVQRQSPVLLLVGTAGCFMWIPVIGWIVSPILLLIAVCLLFLRGVVMLKCNECNQGFAVPKKEYKEFKKAMYQKMIDERKVKKSDK